MKNELAQVLLTYPHSKERPFSNHPAAQYIRHSLPNLIAKEASISSAYKIEGSAGKGRWAEIPWVCIFDKEITQSAQDGYYIVYLFRADMKGVYLSLNQGWTQFQAQFKPLSEAKKKIQESAIMLRESLDSNQGFNVSKIDLATNKILGKGYELGHICGKYYENGKLPYDDILIDDLRNLIGVYRELKGQLSGKPLIQELSDYKFEKVNPYVNESEKPKKEDYEAVKKLTQNIQTPDQIDMLLKKLETLMASQKPLKRQRLANAIIRNQKVVELVKLRANYQCQICKLPGFEKRKGGYYAEVHHVEELSDGGKDLPSNMICICPLCHRKIHYGKESVS